MYGMSNMGLSAIQSTILTTTVSRWNSILTSYIIFIESTQIENIVHNHINKLWTRPLNTRIHGNYLRLSEVLLRQFERLHSSVQFKSSDE